MGETLEQAWDRQDGPPARQVTALVVGCGNRGQNYANFALDFPGRLAVVGLAEPVAHRRAAVQARHGLPDSACLADWHQLLGRGKLADIVIIATQDAQHKEPAVAFAALGYHILVI